MKIILHILMDIKNLIIPIIKISTAVKTQDTAMLQLRLWATGTALNITAHQAMATITNIMVVMEIMLNQIMDTMLSQTTGTMLSQTMGTILSQIMATRLGQATNNNYGHHETSDN